MKKNNIRIGAVILAVSITFVRPSMIMYGSGRDSAEVIHQLLNEQQHTDTALSQKETSGQETQTENTSPPKATPSNMTNPNKEEGQIKTEKQIQGNEGRADVFRMVYPVDTSHVFDFIMDPQQLITKTKAAAYDGTIFEEGATLFFKHSDEEKEKIFSSCSDAITITNANTDTLSMRIILTASISPDSIAGIAMTEDSDFTDDENPSLYLALTDGEITVPISSEEEVCIEKWIEEEYSFWLTGAVNTNGDWSDLTEIEPEVTVTWSITIEDQAAFDDELIPEDELILDEDEEWEKLLEKENQMKVKDSLEESDIQLKQKDLTEQKELEEDRTQSGTENLEENQLQTEIKNPEENETQSETKDSEENQIYPEEKPEEKEPSSEKEALGEDQPHPEEKPEEKEPLSEKEALGENQIYPEEKPEEKEPLSEKEALGENQIYPKEKLEEEEPLSEKEALGENQIYSEEKLEEKEPSSKKEALGENQPHPEEKLEEKEPSSEKEALEEDQTHLEESAGFVWEEGGTAGSETA